jgi:extradiol dioxygenase family protein
MTRTSFAARSALAKYAHKITHKSTYKIGLRPSKRWLSIHIKRAEPVLTKAITPITPITPRPMNVLGLNHFNVTASPALIEQLKNFYVNVIGLTVGPRALLDHDGFWLYAGEFSIVHLSAREQSTCQQSICRNIAETTAAKEVPLVEGRFNHISLSCVGLATTIERMIAMEIPYKIAEVLGVGLEGGQTQIFIKDPAGIGVELTFFNEKL